MLIHDSNISEEAFQEFLLHLLEKEIIEKSEASSKVQLFAYLRTCSRNFIKKNYKKWSLSDTVSVDGHPEAERTGRGDWLGFSGINPIEEEMQTLFDREALQQAILSLKLRPRTVVQLMLDGYKHSEISEILGLPMGTVASDLNRSREKLHAILRAHGVDL